MSRATLIIPVHNRRELTVACLRHLRAAGDLDRFSVLVVDDGSSDGTSEAVRAEFPAVEIVRGDGQLWWTGAIAHGMSHAFQAGAEAVVWLNDDCLPEPGALPMLIEQALAAPQKITAPACRDARTGVALPNAFVGRRHISAGPDEVIAADGLSGFCAVVPRAVWERIGAPDAVRFPHYFGDTAYTLTATRAGFSAVVLGAVRAQVIGDNDFPRVGDRVRAAGGWRESFRQTFVSPKSPRRLRTLFAFQRLKYGSVRGTLLALVRAAGWLGEFALARLRG